jgi:hypothetical protein
MLRKSTREGELLKLKMVGKLDFGKIVGFLIDPYDISYLNPTFWVSKRKYL